MTIVKNYGTRSVRRPRAPFGVQPGHLKFFWVEKPFWPPRKLYWSSTSPVDVWLVGQYLQNGQFNELAHRFPEADRTQSLGNSLPVPCNGGFLDRREDTCDHMSIEDLENHIRHHLRTARREVDYGGP